MSRKLSAEAETNRPYWVPDKDALVCTKCAAPFTVRKRKHHCRVIVLSYLDLDTLESRGFTDSVSVPDASKEASLIARNWLRSSEFQFKSSLSGCGSRRVREKTSFAVTHPEHGECHMSLITPDLESPIKWTSSGNQKRLIKVMQSLQHPHIVPIQMVHFLEDRSTLIRIQSATKRGSVLDRMCKSRPTDPYARKYANGKRTKPISPANMVLWGRQMLEALRFMQSLEFPCHHLHAGNVLITSSGDVVLSDVENNLLGLRPFYRFYEPNIPFAVQCFAKVMYHMLMGFFDDAPAEQMLQRPSFVAHKLKAFVLLIQSVYAVDEVTTVDTLLSHPLFAKVPLKHSMPPLRVPSDKTSQWLAKITAPLPDQLIQEDDPEVDVEVPDLDEPAPPPVTVEVKSPRDEAVHQSRMLGTRMPGTKKRRPKTSGSAKKSSRGSNLSRAERRASETVSTGKLRQPSKKSSTSSMAPTTTTATKAVKAKPPTTAKSSAASAGPPPPPPPAPVAKVAAAAPPPTAARNSLLSSIRGFGGGLKKVTTVDKSAPKV